MPHTKEDYLFDAGVTKEEFDKLLYHTAVCIEAHPGEDAAVGIVCDGLRQPVRERERSNHLRGALDPPNVAGAMIRWSGNKWKVRTFFISRTSQFNRPDGGKGHFRVERTVLR